MALEPARCHRGLVAPAEFLDDVVGRTTLVEHVGKSGAALERVTLGDGRTVIVKRITPETDVTLEIFGEKVARELLLWQSGGLDRLPDGVEEYGLAPGCCAGGACCCGSRAPGAVTGGTSSSGNPRTGAVFPPLYVGADGYPLDAVAALVATM